MTDWSEAQLDALSTVQAPADTDEAAAAWRVDAERAAKSLLDAQPRPEAQ